MIGEYMKEVARQAEREVESSGFRVARLGGASLLMGTEPEWRFRITKDGNADLFAVVAVSDKDLEADEVFAARRFLNDVRVALAKLKLKEQS
jgi:hypothetical protein